MTCADVVDVTTERIKESRRIEIRGSLQQTQFLRRFSNHFRQATQGFSHTAHFTSDVHVPHLVTVAGPLTTFLTTAFRLDEGAVVQTIPHPQTHILGNEQCLVGNLPFIDVIGNVDESRQLFMDTVIRSPHPFLIIIRAIALDEHRMLCRNGIQVAVAIVLPVLFVPVKSRPAAFQFLQFRLWSQVTGFPVATQRVVPHEGSFLTLAQFIDHSTDTLSQLRLNSLVLRRCKSKGQCRHIMSRTVTFEFCGGRVPPICHRITFRRQSVSVAIVIKLLSHVPRKDGTDVEVTVRCQPVVAYKMYIRQWQRMRLGNGIRNRIRLPHHPYLCPYGITFVGGIVAHNIAHDLIAGTHRQSSLLFLGGTQRIRPARLSPFASSVAVGHPHLPRQTRHRTHRGLHPYLLHLTNGARLCTHK